MKKLASVVLIFLSIVHVAGVAAYGKGNKDKDLSKVKQRISKLGVDTSVIVKLEDGRKLAGRIGVIGEDSFVLRTPVKGDRTARLTDPIVINYFEIKQVKYDGPSGGANLGPAFLITGLVILLVRLSR